MQTFYQWMKLLKSLIESKFYIMWNISSNDVDDVMSVWHKMRVKDEEIERVCVCVCAQENVACVCICGADDFGGNSEFTYNRVILRSDMRERACVFMFTFSLSYQRVLSTCTADTDTHFVSCFCIVAKLYVTLWRKQLRILYPAYTM